MSRRPVDRENPDRLYTVTGGRSHADAVPLDVVTLIVSDADPAPGMQSEHARILSLCRRPTAVVEISAELELPVTVVKILLGDLLGERKIIARHPPLPRSQAGLPDRETLKQVLGALQKL